ncbi:MAG TPA: cytochrome c peroxidase [Chitinophagaceae bacterium]|nr:cytochrome c peroxidase [Chitinophagaceae bacterium]
MKKCVLIISAVITLLFMQAMIINNEPANKKELGKLLFFDPILSSDSTISCASCHKPQFAFADSSATSRGVGDVQGSRNTPSAMNVVLQNFFFWDGRAKSLEEQALAPIENPEEMNLPIDKALERLKENGSYNAYFKKIFNSEPNRQNLTEALAAFERSLETNESPFDRWKFYQDPHAVSEAVKRGFIVFNKKGKCIKCHFGSNFAADGFRNIGLFNSRELNDSGRAVISKDPQDAGKFKIAPLRNVGVTAPYMHNGMFKTLKEVIQFYNDPAKIVLNSINRDSLLAKPLGLTDQEKADLESFLMALTDKSFDINKK